MWLNKQKLLMRCIFPLGTGCAPFRSLIEERVSQSAGGKRGFVPPAGGDIALSYSRLQTLTS